MPTPPPNDPTRGYSFTDFSTNNPTQQQPGDKIDQEIDRSNQAITQLKAFVRQSLADDGSIKPGAIGNDQLDVDLTTDITADVLAQVNPQVAAAAGHASSALNSANTAAGHATTASNQANAAAASATTADAAAIEAAARAVQAQTHATNASNASTSAVNARNTAQASEGKALNYAVLAQLWSEFLDGNNVIPEANLGQMGVTGAHWSARWWALKAQEYANTANGIEAIVLAHVATALGYANDAADSAAEATAQVPLAAAQVTLATTQAGLADTARVAAEAALAATLAAYDQFDDRYLGSKTSNPTLDNDGNPLVGGALYFNSVTQVMMLYTGSAWVAAYVSGGGTLQAANNLSDLSNIAVARTNLGLGSAATQPASAFQASDADLDAIAALSTTSFGRGLLTLADAAAGRAALSAEQSGAAASAVTAHEAAGDPHPQYTTAAELGAALADYLTSATAAANYQPLDPDLTAIAALATTAFGRSLLTQADAAAARTTLGVVSITNATRAIRGEPGLNPSFSYTPDGRVSLVSDTFEAVARTVAFTYDGEGRVSAATTTYGANSRTETFSYNADGQVASTAVVEV